MIWAALIAGIVILILLSAMSVAIALIGSKSLSHALSVVDSQQARHKAQLDDLLNRLMAVKWEDYVNLRETVAEEYGGFLAPKEQQEEADDSVLIERPGIWGRMPSVGDDLAAAMAEEDQL